VDPRKAKLVLEENRTIALPSQRRSKRWFQLGGRESGVAPPLSRGSAGDGNGSVTPLKLSSELRVSMFLAPPRDAARREGAEATRTQRALGGRPGASPRRNAARPGCCRRSEGQCSLLL